MDPMFCRLFFQDHESHNKTCWPWSLHGDLDLCMVTLIFAWWPWSWHGDLDLCMVTLIFTGWPWPLHGDLDLCRVTLTFAWWPWSLHGDLDLCGVWLLFNAFMFFVFMQWVNLFGKVLFHVWLQTLMGWKMKSRFYKFCSLIFFCVVCYISGVFGFLYV